MAAEISPLTIKWRGGCVWLIVGILIYPVLILTCFVMYLSHLLYHIYDCCVITVFSLSCTWIIPDYSLHQPPGI